MPLQRGLKLKICRKRSPKNTIFNLLPPKFNDSYMNSTYQITQNRKTDELVCRELARLCSSANWARQETAEERAGRRTDSDDGPESSTTQSKSITALCKTIVSNSIFSGCYSLTQIVHIICIVISAEFN